MHDHPYLMWNFTLAQYDAMAALAKACARLFPNLPATYPQDGKRALIRTALQSPEGYSGYLGHYHVTQQNGIRMFRLSLCARQGQVATVLVLLSAR